MLSLQAVATAVGASDLQSATEYSKLGQQSIQTVLAKLQLELQPEDKAFLCNNFQVDHYGALVRPFPNMLDRVQALGYTVAASFPSSIVSHILKSKYPAANIAVTVWKVQRNAEKLELFVVEGLTSSEFCTEARAINHMAFSPKVLDKQLVHRFKSIMQHSEFLQSSAGINATEVCSHGDSIIQGITLVYFKRATATSGTTEVPSNLEVCMAGMHSDLLHSVQCLQHVLLNPCTK